MNIKYDVVVLGAGPAGLTAGIYLSRARQKTLILSDGPVGGQMILTHEIANYPGVESISGYQLANIMKKQAQSFGCEIIANASIQKMELMPLKKSFVLDDGTRIESDAVILATGGRSRTLGVPGEAQFKGRGISYCATCDGDFFTDKEIVVVGGGNSALDEAVSLTKYASKVTIVHMLDAFQASQHAIEEAVNHPKIDIRMETVITAFHGEESLQSVDLKQLKTGETEVFKTDGVFIFIGYVPNTEGFDCCLDLNERQEIVVRTDLSTNVPGVFSAGDNIDKLYRQVTTAVGDGTVAALTAIRYLTEQKK